MHYVTALPCSLTYIRLWITVYASSVIHCIVIHSAFSVIRHKYDSHNSRIG